MTDHAQRATELAGDCKTTDPRSVQWIMKELEDAYATGRREGLEEAAGICEAEALVDDERGYYGNEMAKAIRVRANEIIQQAKRP